MEDLTKRLSLTDMVTWDKERYPSFVGSMLQSYGEGPFKVVGLRLHLSGVNSPDPVAVTIELSNEDRQEFAGEWFKKV